MYRTGHLGVALLFAAIPTSVFLVIGAPVAALGFSASTIATCRLPDQAEWAVPGIPHRTVTHNVFFIVAVTAVAAGGAVGLQSVFQEIVSFPVVVYVVIPLGAMVGLVSHLAADALTVASGKYAVRPLWPVSKWSLRVGLTKSGSTIANYGLLAAGGLLYAAALWIGLQAPAVA